MNTNVPESGGGGTDGGGDWKTFFVGDAHVYQPACGLSNFTYCTEPYGCDLNGADISHKLQALKWKGVTSDNDLHEHTMWRSSDAPPGNGLDYLFADKHNVAWYLGHGNVGYISFSAPHGGDPWASPCVIGGVQIKLGIMSNQPAGAGGAAAVFVNTASCGGYYGNSYDIKCMRNNWYDGVRQTLAFAGSPVVAKMQATDFIEELEKGKDNLSAWLDIMHMNHEEPFKENNPVVYTYAAATELNITELGTIADNANMLTGAWVKPPLPVAKSNIGISAHSGSINQGFTAPCLPQSAPSACQ